MVGLRENSYWNGWFGGTPISGNHQMMVDEWYKWRHPGDGIDFTSLKHDDWNWLNDIEYSQISPA